MFAKRLENIRIVMKAMLSGDAPNSLLRLQDPVNIQRWVIGYLSMLVCYFLAAKLATPIFRTDTDMWYHLNGGRYFWSTGEVPDTTFFSFIEPTREWVNYFWGFQATIYKIFDLFGYQGLVIFRAILYALIVGVAFAYIFFEQKCRQKPALFIVLACLLIVVFDARTPGLRPHVFSYLFIVLFLYILEYRSKVTPLLPVLMVVWGNVHGVEWVVAALICGSYLIEYVISNRRQGKGWREVIDRYTVSIAACSVALLINPFGANVLATSFAHDSDIYLFISELSEVNPALLYSFTFSLSKLSMETAVTFISTIEVLGVILLIKAKRLRVSHAILAIGGAILVFKGVRFVWEWLFLSLPLAHAVIKEYVDLYDRSRGLSLKRGLLVGYFAVIPFTNMASTFAKYPHYPFDRTNLTTEIVSFLNQNDAKGNLFSGPVDSGYLEWGLYPNIMVYSDMEFPPFDAMSVYTVNWSMSRAEAFGKLLEQYTLDFVVVVTDSGKSFEKMIADFPQFVPIFIDDARILYANAETQSRLVDRYEIKNINPIDLSGKDISDEELVVELKRIWDINPDDRRVNHMLAKILFEMKRYSEALVYAERFSNLYPNDPNSHYWFGKVLENMDRCDLAAQHYKVALKYSSGTFASTVKNHLGSCAYYQKDFDEAYSWFSQSMNPYTVKEDPPHMYQYAYSTAIVGDVEKAIRLLDMLLLTLDPEEKSLKAKAVKFRQDLISDREIDLGIKDWLRSLVE